jgi:hypothetical protein
MPKWGVTTKKAAPDELITNDNEINTFNSAETIALAKGDKEL